jgi:hypothetical protein
MQWLQMVHNLSLGDSAKGRRIVYLMTLISGPEKCKRFMCDADHVRRWGGPSALGIVRGPKPGPVAQAGMRPRRWRWGHQSERTRM